jgi:S-adenosylmethionine:tRNA ribosyltransferase-isomerase
MAGSDGSAESAVISGRTDELDFHLPTELLAKRPPELRGTARDGGRMLVFHRESDAFELRRFRDLADYLQTGDLIVLNDSRTINGDLFGKVEGVGRIELQLRSNLGDDVWYVGCRPWKEPPVGAHVAFEHPTLTATVTGRHPELPLWEMEFAYDGDFETVLAEAGRPIVSPYVDAIYDNQYYNTVYAKTPGSAEMPAAGRHFTPEFLAELGGHGVETVFITLHTGLSSVAITEERIDAHRMYEEWYSISDATAEAINRTRASGRTLLAIGTTVMRVLESVADDEGHVGPSEGWTDLYIYPGHRFRVPDAFLTNFHGPRSTRIALAAAFTGKDLLLRGYRAAIENGFLFYEFGDTTLTLPD